MAKTVGDFLGYRRDRKPPEPRSLYLDNIVENDPSRYCVHCDSIEIEQLRTHNPDGIDYACRSCGGRYEIIMMTSREDNGH